MSESPYLFTSCAMMEFMGMVVPIASALELQASMLKVQFLGMIYSFDPMLCHVVLLMYSQFPDKGFSLGCFCLCCFVEEKEEERRFVTNNSSMVRLSMEKSSTLETRDKAMELVFLQNLSGKLITHSSTKKNEKPIRPRFGFLSYLMGSTKAEDQNPSRKKIETSKKRFLCLCFKPEMVGETEASRTRLGIKLFHLEAHLKTSFSTTVLRWK